MILTASAGGKVGYADIKVPFLIVKISLNKKVAPVHECAMAPCLFLDPRRVDDGGEVSVDPGRTYPPTLPHTGMGLSVIARLAGIC
jgi:hypothetical protein